ncbi:MarR family winged helix-turn-helix transcriptional regulator [Paracoccus sp. MKU1]|uniref:MarR family winged helix-turn-helix transcriptional regulator n=1 Tax=Paracoccus sp. MKU1 TaxID=1745182 RepID=UPI000AEA886E|nr:MarR family transcriptional regulator [Paracoccus sp. MKU1]
MTDMTKILRSDVDAADKVAGQVKHMKKNWPFYWLSRVNARYVQVLERRLKPLGLDMPRWRVLISLYEEEYLSVSEIAEFSVMKLNTATKIVQRLVVDGMVVTRVSPSDGRVTEVTLTPKGDALRQRALIEAEKILAASFVNITQAELEALNGLLEKVLNRLNEI